MTFHLSNHAKEQMLLRGIAEFQVEEVLENPDSVIERAADQLVFQKIRTFENGANFLLRVFVNPLKDPALIITVYKTSKLDKYHAN